MSMNSDSTVLNFSLDFSHGDFDNYFLVITHILTNTFCKQMHSFYYYSVFELFFCTTFLLFIIIDNKKKSKFKKQQSY